MAIRSRDELLEGVRSLIGEDVGDSALAILEDMTDTLNDFQSRTEDSTNWRQRFEENDREWRQKYRDRFFSTPVDAPPPLDDPEPPAKKQTFDSLFKEE